jgi:hypothetical protein
VYRYKRDTGPTKENGKEEGCARDEKRALLERGQTNGISRSKEGREKKNLGGVCGARRPSKQKKMPVWEGPDAAHFPKGEGAYIQEKAQYPKKGHGYKAEGQKCGSGYGDKALSLTLFLTLIHDTDYQGGTRAPKRKP